MKRIFTIIFFFLSIYSQAQVFTGTAGGIRNDAQDTYFILPVTGLSPSTLDATFGVEQVCININHPAVEELMIYLQSPSGIIVQLSDGHSCHGANYTNTCFDSRLSTSVTLMSAPYTGSYKPIGYLGRFNTGQAGNGNWTLIVHDYLLVVDSGNVVSWSITFGNAPSPPVLFTSSNLPIVVINTSNVEISDADILGDMGIISNGSSRNYITDGWNNYNGKVEIHVRGNSTRNFEKKLYSFQTSDAVGNQVDVPILGMPSDNDWTLIAPYQDKTLMRNELTYYIFQSMGHYASRFMDVEVIINNEYMGVYMLAEKPKRNKNRIDVSKLDTLDNSYPQVTGGYVLQIDRNDTAGWSSLYPGNSPNNSHFYYQYDYPKDTAITIPQKNYIKSAMDNFETVMQSSAFADPQTGYPSLLDVNSFIDFLILNELSKNTDAYRLSTYLFKDNISDGGKIHIGPVWDYDIAWHNCDYGNAFAPEYWQYQIPDSSAPAPTWWTRFFEDPNFVNKLNCRWLALRSNILSGNNLTAYIDAQVSLLSEAQPRNFTQWPVLGAYIYPNPQTEAGADYASEVMDLKNWISSRLAWMDANITGSGNCDPPLPNDIAMTAVYPNPFMNDFTVQYTVPQDSRVSIEMVNMIGAQLAVFYDADKTTGTYTTSISSSSLAAGMYLLRITIGSAVFNKRMVKLEMK